MKLRFVFAVFLCSSVCQGELVSLSLSPGLAPDPAMVNLDADVFGDGRGTTSIFGDLVVDLQPTAMNPQSAQITEFNFQLGNGFSGNFGAFANSTDVDIPPILFSMSEVGDGGPIDEDGFFDQPDNFFDMAGTVGTSNGPVDLGDLDPAEIHLDGVIVSVEDKNVMLDILLFSQLSIPIEIGTQNVDLTMLVNGNVIATGVIEENQPTSSNYLWDGGSGGFGSAGNWSEGAGDLPGPDDTITLSGLSTIDLGGELRQVTSGVVNGEVTVTNGTLSVTEELSVEPNSSFAVAAITNANSLTVASGGALVLTAGSKLGVDGALNVPAGAVSIEATEAGSYVLAEFGSSNIEGPISVNGSELAAAGDEFSGHLANGLFGTVSVGSDQLSLTSTQAIAGDVDGNGKVEFADFLVLSDAFGGEGTWTDGDFDGNGKVEFADFLGLSTNFGVQARAETVPEPCGFWLGGLAVISLLQVRRRRRCAK